MNNSTNARLLVVDDSPSFLLLAKNLLKNDFLVTVAASLEEAKELIGLQNFDLALIDVFLPRIQDGLRLARLLRETYDNIGIASTTATPNVYFEKPGISSDIDICLEKPMDFSFLILSLKSLLWRKRLKELTVFYRHLFYCKSLLLKKMVGDSSGALRLEGLLARDRKPIAWVTYKDEFQNNRRVVIGLASSVGCVGGCQFCYSALRPFQRKLTTEEMTAEFLLAFLNSPHLTGFFEKPLNIAVNWTCEGDSVVTNLDNTCATIQNLNQISIPIDYILTTVASKKALLRYMKSYSRSAVASIYYSLHCRPEFREELMPITKGQNIVEICDILEEISKITGRPITVAWALMSGINDTSEDIKFLAKLFAGRPFEVKLSALRPGKLRSIPIKNEKLQAFAKALDAEGVKWRIRRLVGFTNCTCGDTIPTYHPRDE